MKPVTIEDIRNRIAMARAHGDVAASDVINGRPKRALDSIHNAAEYWKEAATMLQSYLDAPTETETKG